MPRIPRSLIKETNRCYHVISRTTGQEFALGDLEKEYLLRHIRHLSAVYFVKVFAFAILSNHFHLLIQMGEGKDASDEEIERRFRIYYGPKRPFSRETAPAFRRKWADLSEYVKEIKQGFSVWYNRQNNRRGYFWSDRFRSVVVENGPALLTCMAYIDLNPVRAAVVDRPEDYRYCGIGYMVQAGNKGSFLSYDLLAEFSEGEPPLPFYRRLLYDAGSPERSGNRRPIPQAVLSREDRRGYTLPASARLRYRSRYFTESVILGSRSFVQSASAPLVSFLKAAGPRDPVRIRGHGGLYSFRRFKDVSA